MPFRLGAAAMMAAILATLVVLIARAVLDPPVAPDIAGRESFLFQHLALAAMAAPVFQIVFLARGQPDYRAGLQWGLGGFAAAVLAPLAAMPQLPAGILPLHDGATMLAWLTTAAVSGLGLWLLLQDGGPLRGDWRGRAVGGLLLVLPQLLAPQPVLPGETVEAGAKVDPLAGMAAGSDLPLMLGLNLLFWLVLGLASVLAARRVVHKAG